MPSEPCSFTDYEENIVFDEDDPDFGAGSGRNKENFRYFVGGKSLHCLLSKYVVFTYTIDQRNQINRNDMEYTCILMLSDYTMNYGHRALPVVLHFDLVSFRR